jgi:hypothetical protein
MTHPVFASVWFIGGYAFEGGERFVHFVHNKQVNVPHESSFPMSDVGANGERGFALRARPGVSKLMYSKRFNLTDPVAKINRSIVASTLRLP